MDFRHRVKRILRAATRTFGEDIVFYPKTGGIFKGRGVFDNEYEALDANTEQLISVNQPALGVNLNDWAFEMQTGDEVVLRGVRFRVFDKREDGQGGATLLLHKVGVNERLRDTKAR